MKEVLLERPADGVALVTLNRPESLNALTYDLVETLHATFDEIDRDQDCRAVILTGAGRGFCAGLDLRGFGRVPGTEELGRAQQGMATQQLIADLVPRLRDLRQPVVAAINGPAAGGGLALALASDVRVCAESARFGTAFVRLGLSGCDIGVSWLLPRLIGASRAWELMLTGRVIDAAEADRLGLVSRLVGDDELLPAAMEIAEQIRGNSPFGVWMTKEVMWSNLETSSLKAAIDLENRTQILASTTDDSREAMAAFLARSPVRYRNR
jgi:enoyl-CoA hydratase